MQQTPIPIHTARVLSYVFTIGAVVSFLISYPEKDARGQDHVLSPMQRKLRQVINAATTVDEADIARIREYQSKKQ